MDESEEQAVSNAENLSLCAIQEDVEEDDIDEEDFAICSPI